MTKIRFVSGVRSFGDIIIGSDGSLLKDMEKPQSALYKSACAYIEEFAKQAEPDVCHIKFHGSEYDFPLTTLGWEENPEHFRYAFVLDNHCIHPEECESITRVGTVFYMLKPNDDGNMVDEKSAEFTDIYGRNPDPIERRLEMAKYTPKPRQTPKPPNPTCKRRSNSKSTVNLRNAFTVDVVTPPARNTSSTAMFYAHSQRKGAYLSSIAVAAAQNGRLCENPATPCGDCRQVMAEFQTESGSAMSVLLVGAGKIWKFPSVEALLPFIFDSL